MVELLKIYLKSTSAGFPSLISYNPGCAAASRHSTIQKDSFHLSECFSSLGIADYPFFSSKWLYGRLNGVVSSSLSRIPLFLEQPLLEIVMNYVARRNGPSQLLKALRPTKHACGYTGMFLLCPKDIKRTLRYPTFSHVLRFSSGTKKIKYNLFSLISCYRTFSRCENMK